MSCNPGSARGAKYSFAYERGAAVRLTTTSDGTIHGLIARSPCQDRNFLELYDAKRLRRSLEEEEEYLGSVRIETCEIIELSYQKPEPKHEKPTEVLYCTKVISTNPVLNRCLEKLQDATSVALNFYGTFVGRDGNVGWITIFYDNTLICIDALELSRARTDFWRLVQSKLFSNDKIEKVIYNARPISDYLFNKHKISLENVVDIQATEFYLQTMWKTTDEIKKMQKSKSLHYQPLSSLLETYLKGVALSDEIKLVQEFEEMDFSCNSPLMERPFSNGKHCKWVAVEMKYLLTLKKELFELALSKLTNCISAQLKFAGVNNDQMERQLKWPLIIPDIMWETLNTTRNDDNFSNGSENGSGILENNSSNSSGKF